MTIHTLGRVRADTMATMTTRSVKNACVGLLAVGLLAGCGSAVPARVQHEADQHAAVSSHLTNDSDVPLSYSVLDKAGNVTLAPHTKLTGPGGAWVVPAGNFCTWRYPHDHRVHQVGAVDSDQWTTFTGYNEVIVSCGPLS